MAGPYLSQFMLIGAKSVACSAGGAASYPGRDAPFDLQDGYIPFGSLIVDQRGLSHKNCLDYMTDWCSWLDVQNGANLKGADQYEEKRRFITTPRDWGRTPFQRLVPALPPLTSSASGLPTWPRVALQSSGTLRISPDGNRRSAIVPSFATNWTPAPAAPPDPIVSVEAIHLRTPSTHGTRACFR